jgi:pimeloyl-ACP methyl ester carboxylesterase
MSATWAREKSWPGFTMRRAPGSCTRSIAERPGPYLLASGHSGMWNYITKDSTLVMIPDANHNVHHDAPELVNRTIRDWLDARRSSGR